MFEFENGPSDSSSEIHHEVPTGENRLVKYFKSCLIIYSIKKSSTQNATDKKFIHTERRHYVCLNIYMWSAESHNCGPGLGEDDGVFVALIGFLMCICSLTGFSYKHCTLTPSAKLSRNCFQAIAKYERCTFGNNGAFCYFFFFNILLFHF